MTLNDPLALPVRVAAFILSLVVLAALVACGNDPAPIGSETGGGTETPPPASPHTPPSPVALTVDTVADGLIIPWEIAFAPDGRIFFTENPGRLRVIAASGELQGAPAFDVTAQTPGGEAGMLGLALDPDFSSNHRLYVVFCTHGPDADHVKCQVARLVEAGGTATYDRAVFAWDNHRSHVAGRLAVGPDRLLYLAIGDAHTDDEPQRTDNPYGKVHRMTLEGAPAPGNPFGNTVFAYGFRDPQGLAFDRNGRLYGTDHGNTSNDEVNLIEAGKNYGWPVCQGRCSDPNFVDPIKLYNPETAAPSGADFYYGTAIPQWTGSFFHSSLGHPGNEFARHVHRIRFTDDGRGIAEEEVLYRGEFGRIRDVTSAPDGTIYFSTSNGSNDKILRIRPQ